MGAIPGFLAPSSWTFWVEAIEPSDTIADVAFTLKTTVPGTESGIRASEFTSGMPQPDDAGARPQRTPPSV
ncbi:MAG: hypothetical protein NTY87_08030 [Planctomycetia bacterium]|nr:hypothetical protein [Planctomycetia bacterium]